MQEELEGCKELIIRASTDLATVAASLAAYGEDKTAGEMVLDDEERNELATLVVTKGAMAMATKKAKEMEERVKEVGSPWMLARGVKTVRVPGMGTLSLSNGTNVSISQDNLRKVLINYIPAEKVAEVMEKVVKKTTYVTLQFKAEGVKE